MPACKEACKEGLNPRPKHTGERGRGRLCKLGEFFLKVQMPACKEACEEGLNHSPKHTEREGEAVQA